MARKFKNKVTEHNYYVKLLNNQLKKLQQKVPESQVLLRYKEEFQPITSEHPNKRKVAQALSKLKKIYKSKELSVKTQERTISAALKTLREDFGIDYVNRKNFNLFFTFLDDARARGLARLYSSTQIIEAVNQARQKGLSKADILANMDYWAKTKLKYNKKGELIEPNEYQPLKPLSKDSIRLKQYKEKARQRARKEARGEY